MGETGLSVCCLHLLLSPGAELLGRGSRIVLHGLDDFLEGLEGWSLLGGFFPGFLAGNSSDHGV